MSRSAGSFTVLLVLLLTACGVPQPTVTPAGLSTTATETPLATPPASTPSPPDSLTLWLAPAFAPETGSAAGELLAERLAGFERSHPGVVLLVRVKGEAGPGGLLDSLTTASQAAPGTLPDLVTLNGAALYAATLKGLVAPLDGLVEMPGEPAWYPYAITAALVDGGFFGVPFAADAEAMAYRSDVYDSAPSTWSDIVTGPAPFLIPAADPTAAFTLAQYLSLGGSLLDDAGRPDLEADVLAEVLGFYAAARTQGVLPLSARQVADPAATWAALRDGRALAAVAPFRAFLEAHDPATDSIQPFPTFDGLGICFADPWSWALVTRDLARQELAAELLNWLMDPGFLGPWSRALGLLPTTRAALSQWPEDTEAALANRLVTSARPRPSIEILAVYGPSLQAAVASVLNGEATPDAAAQAAALQIRMP